MKFAVNFVLLSFRLFLLHRFGVFRRPSLFCFHLFFRIVEFPLLLFVESVDFSLVILSNILVLII